MSKFVVHILAGLLVAAGLIASGCDPFETTFEPIEPAKRYEAAQLVDAPAAGDALHVMNWNVKFGGGRIDFFFDCYGDRALMDQSEVVDHMKGLAAKIRQVDPDVVLLQEVDVEAKRSAYVDQVQWLLDHTDLNYGAYASQWKADYVPSDGLGRMDSGNAILSRWPISGATRRALPLVDEQDALTRYFYLRRNILEAQIELANRAVWVVNVHTSAYSKDGTKRDQIDRFADRLIELDEAGRLFVAGGDLNTLPPGSDKWKSFPDAVCEDEEFEADDYTSEKGWTDRLYEHFEPAIPTADYRQNNAAYFTHTTDKDGFWNRKLDFLFTNAQFRPDSGMVHQSEQQGGMATMPLSDHAPVTVTLELP